MIFQLAVFSLLLLLLSLIGLVMAPNGFGARSRGSSRSASAGAERMDAILRDTGRVYLLFAPYALLLYLQGKPDLLPQYMGWLVIAIEIMRCGLALAGREQPARFLGAVNAVVLIVLWVQALPIFQEAPA